VSKTVETWHKSDSKWQQVTTSEKRLQKVTNCEKQVRKSESSKEKPPSVLKARSPREINRPQNQEPNFYHALYPDKQGGRINITAAWAVDREFDYIVWPAWAPCRRLGPPLGSHWDALGATFGPPLVPFGYFWIPFDRPLDSRWPSWDTFGVHLEHLGPQGVHQGSHWVDLGTSRALK